MIKNILLITFCFIMIFSCGKKGDPVYKETKFQVNNTKFI